jgi:Flp pilus assembly pilin Flp
MTGAARASIQGQAYAEYVVILVVVILLLITGGDNSPINQLIAAFKSFYQSYSYAIAVP